jgi:membrane-bound ClpP family serine protease
MRETQTKTARGRNKNMSEEGDTFWVSLFEKFFGILLIIIGAIMLYFTATSPDLASFSVLFGILSVILLIIGVFLLLVKPPE